MIGKIITGNGREHHITKAHRLNGIGHAFGLRWIDSHGRTALLHLTEGTAARADRTAQEKRCRSGRITLTAVRTAPFLTDGVQTILLDQPLHALQL